MARGTCCALVSGWTHHTRLAMRDLPHLQAMLDAKMDGADDFEDDFEDGGCPWVSDLWVCACSVSLSIVWVRARSQW